MLHYQYTKGEKIALVFLHGFCEDLSMWDAFAEVFENHSLLKVDLPGFGLSATYDDVTIQNMAVEVQRIMHHEQIGEVILIGHSMGGYISLALSRLMGRGLRGVCMLHSHPFEDLPQTKEKRNKSISFIKAHGVSKYVGTLIPTFFAPTLKDKYIDKIKDMMNTAAQLSDDAVINAIVAMRDRPDMQAWVGDLDCPYQCILGTEDIPTPFDFCLPQISLAKITKLTVLSGVGHMGMYSATADTQIALQEFITFCITRQAS